MEKQMGNHYTVQVLNDREFDNLPYKGISDSLGIADREKGLAFVRRTGIKELDEATLHHEIDHLVEKYGTHQDEYGIAHKKVFKDIIAPYILPVVASILAPGLGSMLGIGSTMSGILGGGLGKVAADLGTGKKFNPVGTVLSAAGGGMIGKGMGAGMEASSTGSYLGKLGSGLLGTAPTTTAAGTKGIIGSGGNLLGMGAGDLAMKGTTGAASTNALMGLPSASGQGLAPSAASTFGSISPGSSIAGINSQLLGSALGSSIGSSLASTVNPVAGMPSASGQGLASSAKTAFQGANITPTSLNAPANVAANLPAMQAPTEVAKQTGILSTFGKKAGELATPQNILGGALTLGSTMGKQPEFEPVDIESIRTSLLSGEGVSPLGKQARAKLSQIMSAKPGELYPTGTDAYYQSALRQTEKAYSDAQKSLAKRYNLIDPNYLQNGEYQELARRLDQELASVKSDYAISEEQRRFELSRTQQYQAIQQALQVDDNTMQELLGFTGLAADQAAKKYAVDVNDVNEMRKALGGLGGQVLTSEGGILAGNKK